MDRWMDEGYNGYLPCNEEAIMLASHVSAYRQASGEVRGGGM